MQQHLLDHYLARVLHSQGDHGQAVADEDNVHARGVGDVRRGEVVRRYDGDGLVSPVHRPQRAEGDLFPATTSWALRAQRRVRAVPDLLRRLVEGQQGSCCCCGGSKGG